MHESSGAFRVLILDYTPLFVRGYKEYETKELFVSSLRESMPGNYIVSPDYVRGLQYDIPKKNYDMAVVTASILSAAHPSEDLDRALEQINTIIRDVPTMGICFGLHAIAILSGNTSKITEELEMGPGEVVLYENIYGVGKAGDGILLPVNHSCKVSNSNGNLMVIAVGRGGIQIADASEHFEGNPVFGIQSHPEFAVTLAGWKIFRKIYENSVKETISGKYPGQSLQPILNALGKEAYDRFMESVNDNPNSVIGCGIEKEQYDLLMSPFHNIDYRKKLLGKKESERAYEEMRAKSRGLIANFMQRAVKKKNLKTQRQKPVAVSDNIKPGTQMRLKI